MANPEWSRNACHRCAGDAGRDIVIKRFPMAALMVAALFFGVAPVGTKYALGGFGPVTALAISLTAATVALWILLLRRGYRPPQSWIRVMALGVLEPAVADLFVGFGLNLTTASNAALVSGLESGFVVVLAIVFLRERATWPVVVAVVLAVLGMVVLEGTSSFGAPGVGDLLMMLGTLSAAVYTIVARGLSPGEDSLTVTAHQCGFAAALVIPLAAMTWVSGSEPVPVDVPGRFWVVAGVVGILGFGFSFLLYNAAIVWMAAGPAGVIINLSPAFGLTAAVVLLGESLTAARVIGAGLIGLSVVLFVCVERSGGRGVERSGPAQPTVGVPSRGVRVRYRDR